MKDADFATLWASGRVGGCTSGTKQFQDPLVGPLTVEFQIWLQADSPDHRLEVYSPANQTSADADALLNSITQEGKERTATRNDRALEHLVDTNARASD